MTIFKSLAVVVAAVILLTAIGCRKYGKSLSLPADPLITGKNRKLPYLYSPEDYRADILVYEATVPHCKIDKNTTKDTCTVPEITDTQNKVAQAARNNIAWGLMGLIDDLYNVYSAHLYSGKGAIAIGGDAASAGLTAAVAIARQTAAKTLFGALGTAVGALNLSVDKNLFAQQTYQVIALAMETRRTTIYSEISDSLSKKDVIEYPLAAAKRDLVLYLYAGSLPGGLQEIQKEAGAASAVTDSKTKPAGAPTQSKLTLKVTVAGPDTGTVTFDPPGGSYSAGTVVTLTPKPATGFTFAGWSGACEGALTCTPKMDANKEVTATFKK